ncbi:MAG: hypothetical protein HZC51_08655 [Nitrospirae bacterium]|nr:hypothetical protein [Nitrospirota bacterium]
MLEDLKEMLEYPDDDMLKAYRDIIKSNRNIRIKLLVRSAGSLFLFAVAFFILMIVPDVFGLNNDIGMLWIYIVAAILFSPIVISMAVNIITDKYGKITRRMQERLKDLSTGSSLDKVIKYVDEKGWIRTGYIETNKAVYALVWKKKLFDANMFIKFSFNDEKLLNSTEIRVVYLYTGRFYAGRVCASFVKEV